MLTRLVRPPLLQPSILRIPRELFSSGCSRYFYLEYSFIEDMAYYSSKQSNAVELKQAHHTRLKHLVEEKGATLLGGYHFPLTGGTLFLEAEDDSLLEEWKKQVVCLTQDPFLLNNLASVVTLKEVEPLISKIPFEFHAKKYDYK